MDNPSATAPPAPAGAAPASNGVVFHDSTAAAGAAAAPAAGTAQTAAAAGAPPASGAASSAAAGSATDTTTMTTTTTIQINHQVSAADAAVAADAPAVVGTDTGSEDEINKAREELREELLKIAYNQINFLASDVHGAFRLSLLQMQNKIEQRLGSAQPAIDRYTRGAQARSVGDVREIVHHAIRMRVAQKKSSTSVAQYIIWACGADMPGVPGSGAAARAAIAAGQPPPPFDPTGGAGVKLQRPAGAPESHVFEMQQQANPQFQQQQHHQQQQQQQHFQQQQHAAAQQHWQQQQQQQQQLQQMQQQQQQQQPPPPQQQQQEQQQQQQQQQYQHQHQMAQQQQQQQQQQHSNGADGFGAESVGAGGLKRARSALVSGGGEASAPIDRGLGLNLSGAHVPGVLCVGAEAGSTMSAIAEDEAAWEAAVAVPSGRQAAVLQDARTALDNVAGQLGAPPAGKAGNMSWYFERPPTPTLDGRPTQRARVGEAGSKHHGNDVNADGPAKYTPYTADEERVLRWGVRRYGKSWKNIHANAVRLGIQVLSDRSLESLRCHWRAMVKYGSATEAEEGSAVSQAGDTSEIADLVGAPGRMSGGGGPSGGGTGGGGMGGGMSPQGASPAFAPKANPTMSMGPVGGSHGMEQHGMAGSLAMPPINSAFVPPGMGHAFAGGGAAGTGATGAIGGLFGTPSDQALLLDVNAEEAARVRIQLQLDDDGKTVLLAGGVDGKAGGPTAEELEAALRPFLSSMAEEPEDVNEELVQDVAAAAAAAAAGGEDAEMGEAAAAEGEDGSKAAAAATVKPAAALAGELRSLKTVVDGLLQWVEAAGESELFATAARHRSRMVFAVQTAHASEVAAAAAAEKGGEGGGEGGVVPAVPQVPAVEIVLRPRKGVRGVALTTPAEDLLREQLRHQRKQTLRHMHHVQQVGVAEPPDGD